MLLALSAAFAALAALVATGTLNGLDQWACDHLMPLAGPPTGGGPSLLDSLVPLYHADWHPAGVAVAQIVTLPGQAVISFALVALGAWKLRDARWIAAWFAATLVEVAFRHTLTRPALYRAGVHLTGFDSSWPSGHALHSALVAATLMAAWPRLRIPLAGWLMASVVLLEAAGFHKATDVVGGLLLAALALLAGRALRHP